MDCGRLPWGLPGKHGDEIDFFGGFPEIRGTIYRVPIKRIVVFGGLYLVPPIFGETAKCILYYISIYKGFRL